MQAVPFPVIAIQQQRTTLQEFPEGRFSVLRGDHSSVRSGLKQQWPVLGA